MTKTGNERELEIVDRYLEEHFNPIRRLLGRKIPDPEVRAIAIRRCTRHIFHWQQDVLGDPVGPDHPDYGEPVKPNDKGEAEPEEAVDEDADEVPADKRPPTEWVTGEDPATPRQLAVLRDRGIGVPDGCTKAQASELITRHVYGGARA